jgi:plastocyanin
MSAKGSSAVGIVVAILIVGAVATIGYYQVGVAPYIPTSTTSTSSVVTVDCASTPSMCVNVTIPSGASSPAFCTTGAVLCGYSPETVTVVIGVNNTVLWTNDDITFHSVTSDANPPVFNDVCIDSAPPTCPGASSGTTFQFTFTTPGTYDYHCDYHTWMHGVVIVLAGTGSSSSSSTTATTTTSTTVTTTATSTSSTTATSST